MTVELLDSVVVNKICVFCVATVHNFTLKIHFLLNLKFYKIACTLVEKCEHPETQIQVGCACSSPLLGTLKGVRASTGHPLGVYPLGLYCLVWQYFK